MRSAVIPMSRIVVGRTWSRIDEISSGIVGRVYIGLPPDPARSGRRQAPPPSVEAGRGLVSEAVRGKQVDVGLGLGITGERGQPQQELDLLGRDLPPAE